MIDSKIVDILEKYHSELANEISNINLAIQRIQDELKFISNCLMDDLLSYGKNTGIENKEKELELLKDSQSIVSAKYCYAAHESRLHQNDRCKRFALCLVLTVRFRSLAPWGKLFQLFI